MSGYDRLRHRVEDLSRNFQAEISLLEVETRREMELFRQKVVDEYNTRLSKYRHEVKHLRRENAELRAKVAKMANISGGRTPRIEIQPGPSNTTDNQLQLPYKSAGNKRRRNDSSESLEMQKEDFEGPENAANEPTYGPSRATKTPNCGGRIVRETNAVSPEKYNFSSQIRRISPKKILAYKGKPVSEYSNSQFNKLPTQYSSDCSDSIERPQYINLEEFNRPDLGWDLSPTKLASSHKKGTLKGSPVKEKEKKDIHVKNMENALQEEEGDINDPILDIIEDSQEHYEPLLPNGDLTSSPILADITSKSDAEQNSQHEEQVRARTSKSEALLASSKNSLEGSKIPKLEPKNYKNGPVSASRLHSSPVFGSDGSPVRKEQEKSPFKHVPKLYTALQRKDFLRKYYQLKFQDPEFRVDLETNPVTEQNWRLSDFKPNPLYYKLKPINSKAGVLTNQQQINNRNFFKEAGYGLKSKGVEWEAGFEKEEEEDLVYSQIFDKFPSPPGFMVSDFPDTQEDIRRKEIAKKRQEDRVQRRLKSSMAAWRTGGRVQGEFIFFEDVFNDFVREGRFKR